MIAPNYIFSIIIYSSQSVSLRDCIRITPLRKTYTITTS